MLLERVTDLPTPLSYCNILFDASILHYNIEIMGSLLYNRQEHVFPCTHLEVPKTYFSIFLPFLFFFLPWAEVKYLHVSHIDEELHIH